MKHTQVTMPPLPAVEAAESGPGQPEAPASDEGPGGRPSRPAPDEDAAAAPEQPVVPEPPVNCKPDGSSIDSLQAEWLPAATRRPRPPWPTEPEPEAAGRSGDAPSPRRWCCASSAPAP